MRSRFLLLASALAAVAAVLPGQLRADNPKLVADVGENDNFVIELTTPGGSRVSTLPAGTYDIVVHDRSAFHNFRLTGPGVDRATSVAQKGDTTWTVTFQVGRYSFVCDPHPTQMKGSFTVVPARVQLSVSKAGDGAGAVASSPEGIDCGETCSASFDKSTTVTLTATPGTGSVFSGWGGACTGTSSCSVKLDDPTTVSGTFTLQRLGLTVVRSGNGHGTVVSAPAGVDCGESCGGTFAYGSVVTLTATPGEDSTFTGWGGSCSGAGACSVTVDAAKSVTAAFALKRFALRVTRTGRGRGTVTSRPAGITCGSRCATEVDIGTKVLLLAAPGPGSTFAGWVGACRGGGACALTVAEPVLVAAVFAPVTVVGGKAGVAVILQVGGATRARVELLQGAKRVVTRSLALRPGRQTLRVAAPAGSYRLRLTVGGKLVLTTTVRVGG